jgi:excisionase family DNA binding protein
MAELISVPEAAGVLKLSPARVRLLAAAGDLPASKVGGRWLVERSGVERRRRRGSAGGRPFAPHNAWLLLRLASGEEVTDIDAVVHSRLRRALSLEGLNALAPRLERRAEAGRYAGHPGEVARVLADDRLSTTSVSAAAVIGLDLMPGRGADGYLRASALDEFVDEHALSPAVGSPGNVILRVVPDHVWASVLDGQPHAPEAAVALDLAEDADPRSRAAGEGLLDRLDRVR